jgi:hypothetical protein
MTNEQMNRTHSLVDSNAQQARSRAEPKPASRCLICLIQVPYLVLFQFSYKHKETKPVARIDKFQVASSLNDDLVLCAQIEMQPYGD